MGKKHRKNLTNGLEGAEQNSIVFKQYPIALKQSNGNTTFGPPTDHQYSVSELNISKENLKKILVDKYKRKVENIGEKVCELGNKLNELLQKDYIEFKNGNVLDPQKGNLFYGKIKKSQKVVSSYADAYTYLKDRFSKWEHEIKQEQNLSFKSVTDKDVKKYFWGGFDKSPYGGTKESCAAVTIPWGDEWRYLDLVTNTFCDFPSGYQYSIGGVFLYRIYSKEHKMTLDDLTTFMLENSYIPEGTRDVEVKSLTDLRTYLSFKIDDKSILTLNVDKFSADCEKGDFCGEVFGEKFDFNNDFNSLVNGSAKISGKDIEPLRDFILKGDNFRANRAPYSVDYFTDPNKGVWELAEEPEKDTVKVQLEQSVQANARPPQMDVNKELICAIDFGTKSTVVARRDEHNVVKLLRIGASDFTKKAEKGDYENPTVIEIRDKQSFENCYKARKGRPYTEWEQLTVSHNAVSVLNNNTDKSDVYNTIFKELKQWANDKKRRLQLIDRAGLKFDVPPYLESKEGDFDPIEIYAYYLGLYINNMESGICLHYVLSFPVNYEKEVQDKLLKSFERGLKKSVLSRIMCKRFLQNLVRHYIPHQKFDLFLYSFLQTQGRA